MARPYIPRVGDVVLYYSAQFTYDGNTQMLKGQHARVTVAGALPTLKVLSSGTVLVAVPRTTARTPLSWKSS